MNLVASVINCARMFPHHRRRQSGDFPVLLWVAQTFDSHAATDQDYMADVPMFSNEFYPIYLELRQLCVAERCKKQNHTSNRHFLPFFVDRSVSLQRAVGSSTQFIEKNNEQYAFAIPKKRCKNIPGKKTSLGFLRCHFSGFLSLMLVCLDSWM